MQKHQNYLKLIFYIFKFCAVVFLAVVVYFALFEKILTEHIHIFFYILFWLFSSYFVFPQITRKITNIYLPNYFIGRSRTSDGLLGDPINIVLRSNQSELVNAFTSIGWHQADSLSLQSSLKIAYASVFKKTYETAPVSPLFLFGNKQTFAFEKQVEGNPRCRHHIRFWKAPEDWYLPGGIKVDWLAAATYDKRVGFSLFTGQITHKIDADIDKEREYVISLLKDAGVINKVEIMKNYTTGYQSRNGGGDYIFTDGSLPIVHLNSK